MATVQVFGAYTFNLPGPLQPGTDGVWYWKPPTGVNFSRGTVTVTAHTPATGSINHVTAPWEVTAIAVVETISRVDVSGSERRVEFKLRNVGREPIASFWIYVTLVQP